LDAADDGDWYPGWTNVLGITKRAVAQIVLVISLAFGYTIFNWSKPLLNIIINEQDKEGAPKEAITILGFANVHGSRYALLITVWYLAVSSIGPVVLGLLGSFHYFKTGHQATLSSIQWESAFIPLAKIRYPWTPAIVILNTFGAQILCAVAVPALVLWKVKPQQKGLLGALAKATATHMLFYATINLATTLWAGHLRRHLMLYRIFSPRFMLGAASLVIVDVVTVFVGLWGARMSILSVAEIFGFGG
jgi:phosphatidylinositol glycan class O